MKNTAEGLQWALIKLARQQNTRLDTLRLQACLQGLPEGLEPARQLAAVLARLGTSAPQWLKTPDPAHLPLLAFDEHQQWLLIESRHSSGHWQCSGPDGPFFKTEAQLGRSVARVQLQSAQLPGWLHILEKPDGKARGFAARLSAALGLYKRDLFEACLASGFINLLALATSLFSMQVYDRVIPTRSEHTLTVLGLGVLFLIVFELLIKQARSHMMDHVVVGLDNRLSREIFERLLSIRLDQMPASVGSLAGQIRGYEQVRGFYTSSTLFALIDVPLALIYLVLMLSIGHPIIGLVPLVFGLLSLLISLAIRSRVVQQAKVGAQYANLKVGTLVEAVEGMETIKSGAGGWKFLSRWLDINHHTIHNDLKTKALSDKAHYAAATLQQISYACIVSVGAWAAMQGHITMGAVIACSILGGRVMTPLTMLPGLFVQHAQAKAALEGIEKLYQLKTDEDDAQVPLVPDQVHGHYQLQALEYAYGEGPTVLKIPALDIRPGEHVGILGPIGSGKSTLLRVLSGMYAPTQGKILIDDLEMGQIHKQVLCEQIGYLQQDHRLFQGTLRENLLIGLPDPGDQHILETLRKTGFDRVVAAHPKGLDRPIVEGGKGLSGGQRQLLAFTRLLLTQPQIWLLDEPTASMDEEQEARCIRVLAEEAGQGKTVIVVTHKPQLLPLFSRLMVMVGQNIVLDGPRDAVLQKLRQPAAPAAPVAPVEPVVPTPTVPPAPIVVSSAPQHSSAQAYVDSLRQLQT